MDVYYKVKPGSPTWKRVLEFEEKRDRVFEIQKKVLTKLGIATYKHFGGVFYSMNVLPVTFTSRSEGRMEKGPGREPLPTQHQEP